MIDRPPTPARFTIRQKVSLSVEIIAAYARVRFALHDRDLRAVLEVVRDRPMRAGKPLPIQDAQKLGHVVGRLLNHMPFDAKCLVRSCVLVRLLARRSTPSILRIGVRPGDDFVAHAWVETDGVALLPTGGSEFHPLASL